MATNSWRCFGRRGPSTTSRGGRSGSAPADSKQAKREYALVSPTTPESPATLRGIVNLLKDELQPLRADIEGVRDTLNINSGKLDLLSNLAAKVSVLEDEKSRWLKS